MFVKYILAFILSIFFMDLQAHTCIEIYSGTSFTQSNRPLRNPNYKSNRRKELEEQAQLLRESSAVDIRTTIELKRLEMALAFKEIGLERDQVGIAHFDPAMATWSTQGGKVFKTGPNRVELKSNWISRGPFTARINFEKPKMGEYFGGRDDLTTHLGFRVRGQPGKTWTFSIERQTQAGKVIAFNYQFVTNGKSQDLYLPLNDFISKLTQTELIQQIHEPDPNFYKGHAMADPRIGEWATNRHNVSASQIGLVGWSAYAFAITLDPKLNKGVPSLFGNRGSSLLIESEIVFEKDLREPRLIHAASELILNYVNFHRTTHEMDQDFRKLPNETSQAEIEKFLTKISRSLYNLKYIETSVATLLQGEAAIKKAMDELQVGMVTLDSKLDVGDFFELGRLMDKAQPAVPLDVGAFGEDHFPFAHAGQVITIMQGLDARERIFFRKLLSSCFGKKRDGWVLWDILFDAAGSRLPNSPRFWRNLVEARQNI